MKRRARTGGLVTLAISGMAAMTVSCGPAPSAARAVSATAKAAPAQTLDAGPLPATAAKALPAGVFYLFGGPVSDRWSSVWEVAAGRQKLLTRGRAGRAVDLFGASRAGIIVSDNASLSADLARWTITGPVWLHPQGRKHLDIAGQAPTISPGGEIAYMLPTTNSDGIGDSTIRVRSSWTARDRVIDRSGQGTLIPLFGPRGRIAVATAGQTLPLSRPDVVVLGHHGAVLKLRSGFTRLGAPQIWGPRAPAFVLNSGSGRAELLYLSGRRELLPAGWKALAWDPAGRMLLMENRPSIGIWSIAHPNRVEVIGELNRGYSIWQAYWLPSPARLQT